MTLALWAAPVSADPEVGDLFDTQPGQQFRGWELQVGGVATDGTPYALFVREGAFMIALTKPIARTPGGGITAEKVTKIERVSAKAGETVVYGMDCSIVGVTPVIAFYSKTTGIARCFFVFRDEVREARWFPPADEPCQYRGD